MVLICIEISHTHFGMDAHKKLRETERKRGTERERVRWNKTLQIDHVNGLTMHAKFSRFSTLEFRTKSWKIKP